jgi:hypothetical protein
MVMTEQPQPKIISRSDHETREMIRHFKKRKWRYLLILLAAGAYSFYLFKFHLLEYSSTASFLVNDHDVVYPLSVDNKMAEAISSTENFNRVYELINSAATQKHLIEKFSLLKHYGIDSTREFAYQQAVDKIRSNISVSKSPFNTISVTVKDRYRYLAADMANEIVSFLEKLNEELYISNMQKKLRISESYLEHLKKDNSRKSAVIDTLLQKLNRLFVATNKNGKPGIDLLAQQQALISTVSSFQNSADELENSEKLYNLSLQAMNFKTYPTITTIRTAMPASRSIALTSFFLSLGIMAAVVMIFILQAYLVIHYRDFIRMVINEK